MCNVSRQTGIPTCISHAVTVAVMMVWEELDTWLAICRRAEISQHKNKLVGPKSTSPIDCIAKINPFRMTMHRNMYSLHATFTFITTEDSHSFGMWNSAASGIQRPHPSFFPSFLPSFFPSWQFLPSKFSTRLDLNSTEQHNPSGEPVINPA